MKFGRILSLGAALLAFSPVPVGAEEARPNIVVILVDDVGFSDFGAYGSEIATPNIDALAERGALFSNFHASPICARTQRLSWH